MEQCANESGLKYAKTVWQAAFRDLARESFLSAINMAYLIQGAWDDVSKTLSPSNSNHTSRYQNLVDEFLSTCDPRSASSHYHKFVKSYKLLADNCVGMSEYSAECVQQVEQVLTALEEQFCLRTTVGLAVTYSNLYRINQYDNPLRDGPVIEAIAKRAAAELASKQRAFFSQRGAPLFKA